MERRRTPLAAAGAGIAAGAVATAAMTGYQLAVARLRETEPSSLPAEVGRRVAEGVLRRSVPDEAMPVLNNVVHVAYGTGWGLPYGIVAASGQGPALRRGLVAGLAIWGVSLAELPVLRLAPPVWEQPAAEVALDASYHLVYGLALATCFRLLYGR